MGPLKHLTCRVRKQCTHCGAWTEPGDPIWPLAEVDVRARYGHLACAQELAAAGRLQLQPPACKHFLRHGFCLAGASCFYTHPAEPGAASSSQEEGIRAVLEGVTPRLSNQEARKANRGAGRRNRVRNNWRAAMFRKWLLDTFGADVLGSGSGVLDVGGGSGELSFELVNLNRLPSTVLDPRPLNIEGSLRKLRLGMFQRSLVLGQYNTPVQLGQYKSEAGSEAAWLGLQADAGGAGERAGEQGGEQPGLPPPHIQMMLTDELVQAVAALSEARDPRQRRRRPQPAPGAGGASAAAPAHEASQPKASSTAAQASEPSVQCSEPEAGAAPPPHVPSGQAEDAVQGLGLDVRELREAALRVIRRELTRAESVEWSSKGLRFGEHEGCGDEGGDGIDGGQEDMHGDASQRGQGLDPAGDEAGAEVASAPGGEEAGRGDAEAALALLQGCSIVVGMHPDQAAGAIVDLAVALQKPFALVPCCVYARQFPKRRLSDGRAVHSYEELVRYLAEKDPSNVKAERLPFEGKNIVVYRLPQDMIDASSKTPPPCLAATLPTGYLLSSTSQLLGFSSGSRPARSP